MPRRLRLFFLLGLIALLAVLFAGLLLPIPLPGRMGTALDAQRAEEGFQALGNASSRGVYAFQTFTEEELNAWLADLVHRGNHGRVSALSDVNLNFTSNLVTVVIVARLGPIPLRLKVSGTPEIRGRCLYFRSGMAYLGRVAMPGFARPALAARAGRVFRGLEQQRDLASRVFRFKVGDGWIRAGFAPADGVDSMTDTFIEVQK